MFRHIRIRERRTAGHGAEGGALLCMRWVFRAEAFTRKGGLGRGGRRCAAPSYPLNPPNPLNPPWPPPKRNHRATTTSAACAARHMKGNERSTGGWGALSHKDRHILVVGRIDGFMTIITTIKAPKSVNQRRGAVFACLYERVLVPLHPSPNLCHVVRRRTPSS